MRTQLKTIGSTTQFILADVDPKLVEAAKLLFYSPVERGFAKTFPTNTPNLEKIYRNFELHAENMLLQSIGAVTIPWEKALTTFIQTIACNRIHWWLTGRAALAVRGVDIIPHDIDLVVNAEDASLLSSLLLDWLVEPSLPSANWIADWFGRAFIYARVEWVGGVHSSVDESGVTDFGPTAATSLETVVWNGINIMVPPIRLQLDSSERRGLTARTERINKWIGSSK
jgi:hypothetical protein